ncbi:MAG: zinc ribbon domain-containing protein [Lachnospiraceae bacterium]|nr:zinc ribbon domain-containing protein [Lachnospiraceae bacterium]MBR1817188.1 zinc ribbon domain-containing protein [Lachnospiraceae bacterium]
MICPSCGSNCPDGSVICPNCGGDLMETKASVQPTFNVNDALFNGGGNSAPTQPVTPVKKNNSVMGAVIALIAVVIIAAVVLFAGGVKYMGTYKLTSIKADVYGTGDPIVINIADYGFSEDDFQLKIGLFGRATLIAGNEKDSGTIKYSGNNLTLLSEDGDIPATYDPDNKTIEISMEQYLGSGATIILKKK